MTDITLDFCIIAPTEKLQKPDYSFKTPKIIPEANFTQDDKVKYINPQLQNNITELLIPSKDPKFINASNNINQFTKLQANFNSIDAVKMANLDAITNISKHIHGLLIPKTYEPDLSIIDKLSTEYKSRININATYVDFYGAPGGFSEYFLWRIPKLTGFGFTSKSKDWNLNLLRKKEIDSLSDFTRIYGEDQETGTGDLRTNGFDFVTMMEQRFTPLGVDFVIANGNFSIPDTVLEILYSILILRTGGDLLIKLNNTWDKIMVDTLYICSLIFESIEIIKPVTSSPWDFERYLFCHSKRADVTEITELLFPATEENPIFQDLPDDFSLWLRKINDLLAQKQLNFLRDVVKTMNGETIKLLDLDIDRAYILWGINKRI